MALILLVECASRLEQATQFDSSFQFAGAVRTATQMLKQSVTGLDQKLAVEVEIQYFSLAFTIRTGHFFCLSRSCYARRALMKLPLVWRAGSADLGLTAT